MDVVGYELSCALEQELAVAVAECARLKAELEQMREDAERFRKIATAVQQ